MTPPTLEVRVEWGTIEMELVICVIDPLIQNPNNWGIYTLILRHWRQKNYAKIYNGQPPYKFKLKDFEAFAIRQVLMRTGFTEPVADTFRNAIVGEIDEQLPQPLTSTSTQWLAASASLNFLTDGS